MKIVILNGNSDSANMRFEEALEQLGDLLQGKGDKISIFTLRDLKINYCIGCFNCWAKTPGLCEFKDDMVEVLKEYLTADLVLFVSPVVMGYITYLLKKVIERLLPISHPYFKFVEDRFQHPARYKKVPPIGLLLWNDKNDDPDSLEIIDKIFRSNKIRRHLFTKRMDNNMKEIADEINRI